MSKHESAIRSALRKVASDEAIVIPDLNLAPAEAKTGAPAGASDSAFDVMEFNAERFERRKVDQQSGAIRDDMMWVAQKLADILGSISLNRFATADEAYRAVLTQLQQIVRGENGFIMIPDKKTNRWVIRAWVGDSSGWSDYEKIHPVSLTVANQAYKENRVVTNCFGEDQLDSASLQKLNVQHYVAVPLYRNAQKGGLLYFDNRTKAQPFRQRDVKLLERVGSYVLELDRVVT